MNSWFGAELRQKKCSCSGDKWNWYYFMRRCHYHCRKIIAHIVFICLNADFYIKSCPKTLQIKETKRQSSFISVFSFLFLFSFSLFTKLSLYFSVFLSVCLSPSFMYYLFPCFWQPLTNLRIRNHNYITWTSGKDILRELNMNNLHMLFIYCLNYSLENENSWKSGRWNKWLTKYHQQ